MYEAKRSRVLYQARVMLENKLTVREVAKIIGLSKSTIHKDLTEKLDRFKKMGGPSKKPEEKKEEVKETEKKEEK